MALEWLDSFGSITGRALASLTRFRAATPLKPGPGLHDENLGPVGDLIQTSGNTKFGAELFGDDVNAWERAKADMALEELGRWSKMNAAEAVRHSRVCDACGGRLENCHCNFE